MTQLWWRQTPVKLVISRRKTIAIHVKRTQIEVRAPSQSDPRYLQKFIEEKDLWIENTIKEQQQLANDRIDFSTATHIPFMGFNVQLYPATYRQGPGWRLIPEGLEYYPKTANSDIRPILVDFYQSQAKYWLTKKTEALTSRLKLDYRFQGIQLKRTKSKWGHCTAQGKIQYNWLIMMAPESVIDYLVAHEVCHLKHHNHSKAFWSLVATAHPTANNDRKWLKDNGHKLTLE